MRLQKKVAGMCEKNLGLESSKFLSRPFVEQQYPMGFRGPVADSALIGMYSGELRALDGDPSHQALLVE